MKKEFQKIELKFRFAHKFITLPKKSMSEKKKHRGRIQAQGDGLEASENWSQDEPLTAEDGLALLEKLRQKIPNQEAKSREKEFKKAEELIRRIGKSGGVDAKYTRSFRTKGTKDIRVDIEVLGGKAFITLILLAFILFWLFNR